MGQVQERRLQIKLIIWVYFVAYVTRLQIKTDDRIKSWKWTRLTEHQTALKDASDSMTPNIKTEHWTTFKNSNKN